MARCSGCAKQVRVIDLFPTDLCVECWSVTPEANRVISAQELARMWGGR